MFGRATITLGIGPHSRSCMIFCNSEYTLLCQSSFHKTLVESFALVI